MKNVTDMSGMFNECSSLTELNLSNFNTNKVTNMSNMFNGCVKLKEIEECKNETILNEFKNKK